MKMRRFAVIVAISLLLAATAVIAESTKQVLPAKTALKPVSGVNPVREANQHAAPATVSKLGYRMVTDILDAFGRTSSSTIEFRIIQ